MPQIGAQQSQFLVRDLMPLVYIMLVELITSAQRNIGTENTVGKKNIAKVLVVDDEADLVVTYVRLLQGLGYSSFGAHDGRQAMDLIDTEEPDLVVTDLNLPIMNGFELMSWISARRPQTIIIAITAFHTPDRERAAYVSGARIYMQKPFSNTKLVSAIQSALAGDPPLRILA
jgi:CheY-like chemotaxis protein